MDGSIGLFAAWFLSFVAIIGFALFLGIRDWWQDGSWRDPINWLLQLAGVLVLMWLFAVCVTAYRVPR